MYVDGAQRVILLVPGICLHAYLVTKQRVFEEAVPTTTHTRTHTHTRQSVKYFQNTVHIHSRCHV